MSSRHLVVELDQLGEELARWIEQQVAEDFELLRTHVGAEVAQRTLAFVGEASTKVARDMGEYAMGWQVTSDDEGRSWDVLNPVPYSGVIEMGRRPMRPGPPLQPIYDYVRRKHPELDASETMAMARAVREQVHIQGTPPRRILGDTVDAHWGRWIDQAIDRHIARRRRRGLPVR